jgi:rRNA maturation RNase YbeY
MKIQVHNVIKSIPLSQRRITEITEWLCKKLKLPVDIIDIIFTDDEKLRNLHENFLNDADYTDVMTFNLGSKEAIEGEIYISKDRAIENSSTYNNPPENEICRLIIHAFLHLAGYEDNNKPNRRLMKKKEEELLSIVLTKFIY